VIGFECDVCGRRAKFDGGPPPGWRIMAASVTGPEPDRATLCSLLCMTIWGEQASERQRAFEFIKQCTEGDRGR
jgi:hypothetical protein